MQDSDRIYYSADAMQVSLEGYLENLKTLRYDSRYKALLGEAFISRMGSWEREIRQRKEDPFTVVVVGDFKRGKSMLINALLQEEVVPTNVTPETVTLNRITYGAHSNEAVLSSGRRMRLSDEELNRHALEGVLAGLGEKVERLELKRENPLLKKISIIDTPGLSDAMEDFTDMVKDSLLQADAVIYVFSAMYPLSMSEQIFLRSAVIPQKYTTLFLAANFTDILRSEEEYARVRETIEQRAETLLPQAEILMISALDEVCRTTGEERPETELTCVLEEQFGLLRSRLDALIEQKADSVVIDRMQRLTAAMVQDLRRDLDALNRGLDMTAEDAAAQREAFRQQKEKSTQEQASLLEKTDRQVAVFQQETTQWMGEFLQRMADEVPNLASQSSDTLRRYYEVYCIELLEQALTICTELHQAQLYDTLDEISSEVSRNLTFASPADSRFGFRFHLDNRVWTKGDTAGLALSCVSFGGLLGTVASLAADGVAGLLREKETEQKKPELLEQISSQMTGLTVSVQEAVKKVYGTYAAEAQKLVLDYYAEQLADSEHALEQAVRVAAKEEAKKEELRALLHSAEELLCSAEFMQA